MKPITSTQLKKKIGALGKISEDQRNSIICSLIGHSRIQDHFFGYYNCSRCDKQLGDALGGIYTGATEAVVRGHNCKTCRANFKKCTWQDKLYVRDPFKDDFLKHDKAPILLTL